MSTPSLTDAADTAWADLAWAVDSDTRHCRNGIGDHTAECTVPAELAAVAPPADAQHVEDWRDDFGTGEYERFFRSTRRSAAGVSLAVTGFQAADGTARRDVHIFAADVHLDAAALRKVAAMALEAADELDYSDYTERTARCLQCDQHGRVRAGATADGVATYRAALCRHDNPDQLSLPTSAAATNDLNPHAPIAYLPV